MFLAGLELMVTAVALPTIILDFSANAQNPFAELRRASWIVNGYLLAYIVAMPLAGRMADVWGARRLFLGALGLFVAGSFVAGAAQSIDQLIGGRVIQGVGGGILVPVGTAVASHLFEGHARPRALGVIGALTFLGMAAGPFVGAAIRAASTRQAGSRRSPSARGPDPGVLRAELALGLLPQRPDRHRRAADRLGRVGRLGDAAGGGRIDVVGAVIWTIALGGGLVAVTLLGSPEGTGVDPLLVSIGLGVAAVVATIVTIVRGFRVEDPFIDPRLFRSLTFASAAAVSLLTGYAFATAIVGGAVFVDRVLYGGPEQQQVALGSLAAATAVGALVSGFAVRYLSLRLVTVVGLAMSAGALLWMARWTPAVALSEVALVLAIFGAGFGLTVTPRSTAAVETAGRASFGMASAIVTVARMIGMAIGVAVLTAYGSTTINHLYDELFAVPDGWKRVIPEELATAAAGRVRRGCARGVGVGQGVGDPRRPVRGRGRRHDRRGAALALGGAGRTRMLADDRGEDAEGVAAAAGRTGARWTRRAKTDDRPLSRPAAPADAAKARPDRLLVAGRRRRDRRRREARHDAGGPGDPRLGRPRRSVARGRPVGRPRARAPSADRRGHRRTQPAGQDRDLRRRHRAHRLFDLDYHGEVQPAEIDLVLGRRFLVSVHGDDCDVAARAGLRDGPSAGAVLAKGPDFLLYTIADRVVDGYFPVMDHLADEIDDLQDRVSSRHRSGRFSGCSC